jgi:hypothetical protein
VIPFFQDEKKPRPDKAACRRSEYDRSGKLGIKTISFQL